MASTFKEVCEDPEDHFFCAVCTIPASRDVLTRHCEDCKLLLCEHCNRAVACPILP